MAMLIYQRVTKYTASSTQMIEPHLKTHLDLTSISTLSCWYKYLNIETRVKHTSGVQNNRTNWIRNWSSSWHWPRFQFLEVIAFKSGYNTYNNTFTKTKGLWTLGAPETEVDSQFCCLWPSMAQCIIFTAYILIRDWTYVHKCNHYIHPTLLV